MKVAAALHTVKQHSRPGRVCSQISASSKIPAQERDSQAREVHLSESWNACQGCSSFLAQTMRMAGGLHTMRQHSRPQRLLAGLEVTMDIGFEKMTRVPEGRTCQIVGI